MASPSGAFLVEEYEILDDDFELLNEEDSFDLVIDEPIEETPPATADPFR